MKFVHHGRYLRLEFDTKDEIRLLQEGLAALVKGIVDKEEAGEEPAPFLELEATPQDYQTRLACVGVNLQGSVVSEPWKWENMARMDGEVPGVPVKAWVVSDGKKGGE